jgi:solute carrier family 35 (UDP-sugar transporter), member A1/2/3
LPGKRSNEAEGEVFLEKTMALQQQKITGAQKLVVAATLTIFTCSQGLLMEASKINGKYEYNSAVVPLFSELVKLILSMILLRRQIKRDTQQTQMTTDLRSVLMFPIPSVIYVMHNNVQFYTMAYVDAATYQILGNLKIVTTGVLFRFALGRMMTRTQWIALLLLTIGATVSQISGCAGETLSAPIAGYLLGILSACLSATAGVYTEFLLKKNNDSLYWQNVQLYAFGVVFNAARLTWDDFFGENKGGNWLFDCTDGFTLITWLIVINFSFSGLFVSWLQKFADTIVKVYATSSAMLLTALLSVSFFGLEPSLQLFLGITIACCSLVLYFMPPDAPKEKSLPTTTSSFISPRGVGQSAGENKLN